MGNTPPVRTWSRKKAPAVNKAGDPGPSTFIESNLVDLKGMPITNRIMKDPWGQNSVSGMSIENIVEKIAQQPEIYEKSDFKDGIGKGFYPAGTTTGIDPSRQNRIKKPVESKASKHAYGPGQLFGGGRKADLTGGFKR